MKKSFMTRALATGLSFAMAFSLSAATNVTTASAAAKKASVTTFMKVASKSVTEGKKVTTYMNSTATKKYRIKSHTESATAKKYISVVMTSNRKGLTIEAKDGVLAQKNLTKKGVNVKINFAPATSVAKVKKAAATKYVNLKVVVNAKPVEKLTMTAAATAVKEITLTFNKAVADTTVAKITVKKGNATPTFTAKWADDKKSVVLAMDSKLTKGTYDVTVSGLEKEDLTASVVVEDQKLAAFELISTNLVASPARVTDASIQFRAVDQYGKNYPGVTPTVTTSFGGTATPASATKSTENTKINVTNMSSALALVGTKGTITIVDNSTGVNLTSEITYVAAAKASKVEVIGVYNKNTGKLVETMTAGDVATNKYAIALKFTDQYDTEMAWNDSTFSDITTTLAAGTTNLSAISNNASGVVINDKTYYALDLTGTLAAGTFQITVVNSKVGLLANLSFDVVPGTVIKSFSVSADNDIFAGEKATLSYTAIDAEGKEVTSFDELKKAFNGTTAATLSDGANVTIEKQKDGSAKLVYYQGFDVTNKNTTTKRGSDSKVITFQLYSGSANIIVVNTNIRVNEKRYIWEVTGIASDKAIAGNAGDSIDYKLTDLKVSDQYGNTLSTDNIKTLVANGGIDITADVNGSTGFSETNQTTAFTTSSDKMTVTVGTDGAKKYTFKSAINGNDNGYTVTVSKVDSTKATDFAIKWNTGVTGTFAASNSALSASYLKSQFSVIGKVGGKTVTIPDTDYEITALTGNGQLGAITSTNPEKTVDGKITVTVRTVDEYNKSVATDVSIDFKASNADAKLTTIKANENAVTATTSMNVVALTTAFDLTDQYGNTISSNGVAANVVILNATASNADVEFNGTTACVAKNLQSGDKISITLTKGDLTATREITLQ